MSFTRVSLLTTEELHHSLQGIMMRNINENVASWDKFNSEICIIGRIIHSIEILGNYIRCRFWGNRAMILLWIGGASAFCYMKCFSDHLHLAVMERMNSFILFAMISRTIHTPWTKRRPSSWNWSVFPLPWCWSWLGNKQTCSDGCSPISALAMHKSHIYVYVK